MSAWWKTHRIEILFSILAGILFCIPYLCKDLLAIEQDTFFHLSRIDGLAQSIAHGSWFPEIYPAKNFGYGYASPTFYCDFFLILPALLNLAGCSLAFCYKFTVLCISILTAYTMTALLKRITKSSSISMLVSFAYLFCNYRMSDVYVRGAFGEVMAMIFLPVILSGLYELLEQKNIRSWPLLTIGLCGLVYSHNLSFLFGVILILLFAIVYLPNISKEVFQSALKGCVLAFLFSAWFTLPMLEQLKSQTYYVDYYAKSDLSQNAMPLVMYLQNFINFGQGGYALPQGQYLTLNPGVFLSIVPLFYFGVKKKQKFVWISLLLSLLFLLLPGEWTPWESLSFLGVIQFPWRLLTIATVLLCIPAAMVLKQISTWNGFRILSICLSIFLLVEGGIHLCPATTRTFGLSGTTTWQDVRNGSLIDPTYSAFYSRVELAGADYLPVGSPDFTTRPNSILDGNGLDCAIPIQSNGTTHSFTIPSTYSNQILELPITWYKGYQVYQILEDGTKHLIPSWASTNRLVTFQTEGEGSYICAYERTTLRLFSLCLSAATLLSVIGWILYLRMKKSNSIHTPHSSV